MNPKFNVDFLDEAIEFLEQLDKKTREKIFYNIIKSQCSNDPKLFKKLNDNIWEFRTVYNKKDYRLFSFWRNTDIGITCVIATHGILKKTQKTPSKEIKKAEKLRKKYFKNC